MCTGNLGRRGESEHVAGCLTLLDGLIKGQVVSMIKRHLSLGLQLQNRYKKQNLRISAQKGSYLYDRHYVNEIRRFRPFRTGFAGAFCNYLLKTTISSETTHNSPIF